MSAGFSDANSTSSTTTTNTDRRLTTYNGDIQNLEGASFTAYGGSSAGGGAGRGGRGGQDGQPSSAGDGGGGGQINILTANADVARQAILSVTELARRSGDAATAAAQTLAAGSNKIAADVAASQTQFVATASGQKYVLYALAGIVALVVMPQFFKGRKTA